MPVRCDRSLFSVRSLFVGTDQTPAAALTARARELWECLAGAAAGFTPGISVAVVPRSYLCPPGWAGMVVLGSAALATAPDHDLAGWMDDGGNLDPAPGEANVNALTRAASPGFPRGELTALARQL